MVSLGVNGDWEVVRGEADEGQPSGREEQMRIGEWDIRRGQGPTERRLVGTFVFRTVRWLESTVPATMAVLTVCSDLHMSKHKEIKDFNPGTPNCSAG